MRRSCWRCRDWITGSCCALILLLGVVLSGMLMGSEGGAPAALGAQGGAFGGERVIDVHGHIGEFRGFDLSMATLLDNIERNSIGLVLVSNIDGAHLPGTTANSDEERTNRITLDAVRKHPERLRGLLWTRPEDGSPARIEAFLRETLGAGSEERVFVGLKIHPEMNDFPADDRRVDPYLELCEKHGVPAVFHSGRKGSNSDPERIHAVARRHPRVPVILYHMGFGRDHAHALAVAKEALAKRDAQLYLETAQAEPEAVIEAVRTLGSERILFGTDATYYGRNHYARYEALLGRLRSELSADDYSNIVRRNAERLFKVK